MKIFRKNKLEDLIKKELVTSSLKKKADWLRVNQKHILDFFDSLKELTKKKLFDLSIDNVLSEMQDIKDNLVSEAEKSKYNLHNLFEFEDVIDFSERIGNQLLHTYENLVEKYKQAFEKTYKTLQEEIDEVKDLKEFNFQLKNLITFSEDLFKLYQHPYLEDLRSKAPFEKIISIVWLMVKQPSFIRVLNEQFSSVESMVKDLIPSSFGVSSNDALDLAYKLKDLIQNIEKDAKSLLDYNIYTRAKNLENVIKIIVERKRFFANFESYYKDYENIKLSYINFELGLFGKEENTALKLLAVNKLISDMSKFLDNPAKISILAPPLYRRELKKLRSEMIQDVNEKLEDIVQLQYDELDSMIENTSKFSGRLEEDSEILKYDLKILNKIEPIVEDFIQSSVKSENYTKNRSLLTKLNSYRKLIHKREKILQKSEGYLGEAKQSMQIFREKTAEVLSQRRNSAEKLVLDLDLFIEEQNSAKNQFDGYLRDILNRYITLAEKMKSEVLKYLEKFEETKVYTGKSCRKPANTNKELNTLFAEQEPQNSLLDSERAVCLGSYQSPLLDNYKNLVSMLESATAENLSRLINLLENGRFEFEKSRLLNLERKFSTLSKKYSAFEEQFNSISRRLSR